MAPSPHAIATRLSYFLWDTMPDEALFKRRGCRGTVERRGRQQSNRADDCGSARSARLWTNSLRSGCGSTLCRRRSRTARLYPQFSPELAIAMTEETKRLIADLVWSDRNFMDLFTARHTYVNSDLASLYGIPAPKNDFDQVSLPETAGRAGILGHGTFLAQTSKPGETSPTVRGYFVREHFFCHQVPDPPPGTNSNLPPLTVDRPQTNRDRLNEHLINRTCAGCHSLMDPIGFGFEKFDAIGKRREKQTIKFFPDRKAKDQTPKTVTLDLNTSGKVSGLANSDFQTPVELGQILANSRDCQECIVKQLFRYAYGRRETDADQQDYLGEQARLSAIPNSGSKFLSCS